MIRTKPPNGNGTVSDRVCPVCQKVDEDVKRGRPTKYRTGYDRFAFQFALLGATNEELASSLNIDIGTLHNWKHQHPSFLSAIKKGKEEADARVANALYHRALGYEHPEEKVFLYKGEPVVVPTTKHHPPDTGAAFIWLKNRQPHLWRDRQNLELTGKDGGPIELERRYHIIQEIVQNPNAREGIADRWREGISPTE